MNDYKFIMTDNSYNKDILLELGYLMIKSSNNFFIFKNDDTNFKVYENIKNSKLDKSKLTFTNKLYF